MTLTFFSSSIEAYAGKHRYYLSQFDRNTYQIVDSVENREICICSNYDDWEDAEKRANKIVNLLNANNA
jgi:hypothetical protein